MDLRSLLNSGARAAVLVCSATVHVRAQDSTADQQHQTAATDRRAWTLSADANVFFGYNYQQRKFADFSAWESQNWFMGRAARPIGSGRLTLDAMLSLEPWTIGRWVYAGSDRFPIKPGGSPQLHQTGETFNQDPLINYQHPHDLFMGLSASYRIERPRLAYIFTGALVGPPALGPTPFMHRESARNNPQVPLAHHSLDATHITTGVLTAGVEVGQLSFETSAFRGEEPDEERLDIDRPRLDSWSARIGWRRGGWQAQVSGGHLHEPEWYEPWDVTRLTASIAFSGDVATRPFSGLLAWGHNIEYNGFNNSSDAYLVEWDLRAIASATVYGRAETMRKQVLGVGFHPKGLNHPHVYSAIAAFTIGAVRDVLPDRWGRVGIGGDVTVYRTSADLHDLYGSSHSYHVFLRWRPSRAAAAHVH